MASSDRRPAGNALARRLDSPDEAGALRDAIAWLLSGDAQSEVDAIVSAVASADAPEFGAELATARRIIGDADPGDPGIVVALLMNLVTLRRGEAIFVPAGVLHAYLEGLGVELMAASDNVLRGGLTPKHIDVAELLTVLDPTPGPPPILRPALLAGGIERFDPGVPDFALLHVRVTDDAPVDVPITGVAIALATRGSVDISGGASAEHATLIPGAAVLATEDERMLRLRGSGEVFVAVPGATG